MHTGGDDFGCSPSPYDKWVDNARRMKCDGQKKYLVYIPSTIENPKKNHGAVVEKETHLTLCRPGIQEVHLSLETLYVWPR